MKRQTLNELASGRAAWRLGSRRSGRGAVWAAIGDVASEQVERPVSVEVSAIARTKGDAPRQVISNRRVMSQAARRGIELSGACLGI